MHVSGSKVDKKSSIKEKGFTFWLYNYISVRNILLHLNWAAPGYKIDPAVKRTFHKIKLRTNYSSKSKPRCLAQKEKKKTTVCAVKSDRDCSGIFLKRSLRWHTNCRLLYRFRESCGLGFFSSLVIWLNRLGQQIRFAQDLYTSLIVFFWWWWHNRFNILRN